MALKRRHKSHELATNDRLLQWNRESDTNVTIPLRRIPTSNMRTLRNVDIAACEIQTGYTGPPPPTGPLDKYNLAEKRGKQRMSKVLCGFTPHNHYWKPGIICDWKCLTWLPCRRLSVYFWANWRQFQKCCLKWMSIKQQLLTKATSTQ